jgi:hypothetical protein
MTDPERRAALVATLAPSARLEPDAIGTTQDTIIGMASSAPAATMAVTMAGLAAAAAYGGGRSSSCASRSPARALLLAPTMPRERGSKGPSKLIRRVRYWCYD